MIDTLFVGIRWLLQRLGHTITAVFEPDAVSETGFISCFAEPGNGRASLRHHQGVDGGNPLPDQIPGPGRHRDEPACARLQSQTGYQHHRRPAINPGHAGGIGRCNRQFAPVLWSNHCRERQYPAHKGSPAVKI